MTLALSDTDIDTLLEIDRGQRDRVRRRQEPTINRSTPRGNGAPVSMAPTQSPPTTPKAVGPVDRNGVQLQVGMPISVPMSDGSQQTVKILGPGEGGNLRVQTARGSISQASPSFLRKGTVPPEAIPKPKPAAKPKAKPAPIAVKPAPEEAGPASVPDVDGRPINSDDRVVLPSVGGKEERVFQYIRMNRDGSAQMKNDKGINFAIPASVLARSKLLYRDDQPKVGNPSPSGSPQEPSTPVPPTGSPADPEAAPAANPKTGFVRPSGFHDVDGDPINLGEPLSLTIPDGTVKNGKATETWNGKLMIAWDDGQKAAYTPEDITGQKIGDLKVGASTAPSNTAGTPPGANPAGAAPTGAPATPSAPARSGVPQNVLSKITTEYYVYQDDQGQPMIVKGHSINDGDFTADKTQKLSPKEAKNLLLKYGNAEGQEYVKGVKVPQGRIKAAYNAFKNPPMEGRLEAEIFGKTKL